MASGVRWGCGFAKRDPGGACTIAAHRPGGRLANFEAHNVEVVANISFTCGVQRELSALPETFGVLITVVNPFVAVTQTRQPSERHVRAVGVVASRADRCRWLNSGVSGASVGSVVHRG